MAPADLDEIVGTLYEAALDQNDWQAALQMIVDYLRGTAGSLTLHSPTGLTLGVGATTGYDPAWLCKYREHYHKINIQASAVTQTPEGVPVTGQDVVPMDALLESEYYHDFLKRQNLLHIAGGVVARTPCSLSMIAIQRPAGVADFGSLDLAALDRIMKYLKRAMRLHERFRILRAGARVLDELEASVVVVSQSLEVMYFNASARALLDRKDGLILLGNGQLSCIPGQLRELRSIVAEAINPTRRQVRGRETVLAVRRKSMQPAYQVSVVALPASTNAWFCPDAVAVLLVTDPDQTDRVRDVAKYLMTAWALTRREAEVAAILASGKDIQSVCDQLVISRPTARTHLAGVFSKLGVRRQGELVALLLRGRGGIRSGTNYFPPQNS